MSAAQASAPVSQDPIDEAMAVTTTAGWFQLAAVAIALIVALVWSALVEVPIKVKGRGILMGTAGVAEISMGTRGRILRMDLRPGDVVTKGGVVAEIEQPDQAMQLTVRQVQLREAIFREQALIAFRERSTAAQSAVAVARIQAARQRVSLLADREHALRERDTVLTELLRKGLTQKEMVLRNQADLTGVIDQSASAQSEVVAVQNDLNLQQVQSEKELLAARQDIARIGSEVEETARLLAQNREVRSPYSGRVIEVKHGNGDFVEPGSAILALDLESPPGQLRGTIFIPPENGKEIRPGMRVEIAPSGVKSNEYGFIVARVISSSDSPATSAGMQRALHNDQLVKQLSAQGAPFQVDIALETAGTRSGFRWTSSNGPAAQIDSGTPCEASIVTRDSRLLGLLIPPLARLFAR